MYKDDQKALVMLKDSSQTEKLKHYFFQRYNLHIDTADDILEVFNLLGADDCPDSSYELLILDENVAGLSTTAQSIKTLKSKYPAMSILYLSTILELAPANFDLQDISDPLFDDDVHRMERIDLQMDRQIALQTPLTEAGNLADTYQTVSLQPVLEEETDYVFCSVLRLDQNPASTGVLASNYPEILTVPTEYPLKGTGHLTDMMDFYKPVHIPDMEKESAFSAELEEKFARSYRSALLVPMQFSGKAIGCIGFFMRDEPRMYLLPDLDICQRYADMATVAIIAHFYKEHSDLDMDKIEEDVKGRDERWND